MVDLILASLHHILVFSLAAVIATEVALTQVGMSAAQVLRVGKIDLAYGVIAGLILAVGFARVFFGRTAADYYLTNIAFDLKLGAFLLVGLLSIWPTVRFLKWRKRAKSDPQFTPPAAEVQMVRNFIHAEAAIFVLIPVFAAAMARGFG